MKRAFIFCLTIIFLFSFSSLSTFGKDACWVEAEDGKWVQHLSEGRGDIGKSTGKETGELPRETIDPTAKCKGSAPTQTQPQRGPNDQQTAENPVDEEQETTETMDMGTDPQDTTPTTPETSPQMARTPRESCTRPLSIVNVEHLKKPSRIYLTIRNNSQRFQSLYGLTLQLLDENGEVKRENGLPRVSITYQKSRGEEHADSYFVLYRYRKGLLNHQRQPEEKVISIFPVKYEDGDVFVLVCGDDVISRYPEEVAAAPMKQPFKTTTLWGSIKQR